MNKKAKITQESVEKMLGGHLYNFFGIDWCFSIELIIGIEKWKGEK
ncbi:hypothetical protein [Bacillus thuringiensis]|nr:hypothetical protein [Bacillus thuringiensis]